MCLREREREKGKFYLNIALEMSLYQEKDNKKTYSINSKNHINSQTTPTNIAKISKKQKTLFAIIFYKKKVNMFFMLFENVYNTKYIVSCTSLTYSLMYLIIMYINQFLIDVFSIYVN